MYFDPKGMSYGYELEMPSGVVHDTWSAVESGKILRMEILCAVFRSHADDNDALHDVLVGDVILLPE
ncbi:hypothetical protein DPMN_155361 [Dreissena polymorpha]|uniref:Uncharacterized protein n=1 Tax=Dreissena polymorpha TaxID=45954 RepID=A0A9D4FRM5_DREPO|nr:hypothetical protein DPMN_155361 [Dreissena polymorpha]